MGDDDEGVKFVAGGCAGCCGIGWFIFFCVMMSHYKWLGPKDQVLIKTSKGHRVVNGPHSGQFNPFQERVKREATLVDDLQYAVIQDRLTAKTRSVSGPTLLFMLAYDELKGVMDKLVLEKDEYVRLVDRRTGMERVEQGPAVVSPTPTELYPEGIRKGVYLNVNNAVVIKNKSSGMHSLVTKCTHPSGVYFPAPMEELIERRNLIQVLPHEAIVVRDVSGVMSVYSGADNASSREDDTFHQCFMRDIPDFGDGQAFFLEPYSKIVRMKWSDYRDQGQQSIGDRRLAEEPPQYDPDAVRVPVFEYIHEDNRDRKYIREADKDSDGWSFIKIAFFGFLQSTFDTVPIFQHYNNGTNAHEYTQRSWPQNQDWQAQGVAFHTYERRLNGAEAVYEYRNTETEDYQYTFGTVPPGPEWESTVVNGNGIAFFAFFPRTTQRRLQNAAQAGAVVPLASETSLYVDQSSTIPYTGPTMKVSNIDLRQHKAFFNYQVRTQDNVRMEVGGVIFWRVQDVGKMVSTTANPTGDIWSRCRATLAEAISNRTLVDFMNSLDAVSQQCADRTLIDNFYSNRGLGVTYFEITKYAPMDDYTKGVLQQIIRQTVLRINALTKQESENEVNMAGLMMEVSLESNRSDLIKSNATNEKLLAETAGVKAGAEAGAEISAFMEGIKETLPNATARVDLFKKKAIMSAKNRDSERLAKGDSKLFVSPSTMDLRLSFPKKDG